MLWVKRLRNKCWVCSGRALNFGGGLLYLGDGVKDESRFYYFVHF